MRKKALALLLAAALVGSMTACGASPPETSQGEPPPETAFPFQAPPPETTAPEESPSEPASAPDPELDALVRQIIMTYGGETVTQKDGIPRLRRKSYSLFDTRYSWNDPVELPASSYYDWFFSSTLAEDDAYRREHYAHPEGKNSWFYPQEVFEERVQTYFDVPTEFLRRGPEYDPERKGYWREEEGACGSDTPEIAYTFDLNGNNLTIQIRMDYPYGTILAEEFCLSVLLEEDGGWKYWMCWCRPNELPMDAVAREERERYLSLTPEQWALIDRAEKLARIFFIEPATLGEDDKVYYRDIDYDDPIEINGIPGYVRYTGDRYQGWEDFRSQMLSVFTEEFFSMLNQNDSSGYGIFTGSEGELYLLNLCKDGSRTYLEQDRFSVMAADDWIQVTRYAYYQTEGEEWKENPQEATAVRVRAMPIVLKNTENGWRVDYLKLP